MAGNINHNTTTYVSREGDIFEYMTDKDIKNMYHELPDNRKAKFIRMLEKSNAEMEKIVEATLKEVQYQEKMVKLMQKWIVEEVGEDVFSE